MRRYANYNDYELIYLYRNGSEAALNVLINKYYVLTEKVAWNIHDRYSFITKEQVGDLIQEGIMVVYRCLQTYKDDVNVTFYNYALVSIKRRMFNLLSRDNYYQSFVIYDNYLLFDSSIRNAYNQKSYLNSGKSFFSNDIDIIIYEECIIGDNKYKDVATYYNISYQEILRRKNKIVSLLKKVL